MVSRLGSLRSVVWPRNSSHARCSSFPYSPGPQSAMPGVTERWSLTSSCSGPGPARNVFRSARVTTCMPRDEAFISTEVLAAMAGNAGDQPQSGRSIAASPDYRITRRSCHHAIASAPPRCGAPPSYRKTESTPGAISLISVPALRRFDVELCTLPDLA